MSELNFLYGEFCEVCRGDYSHYEIKNGKCSSTHRSLIPEYLGRELQSFENLFTKTLGSSMRNLQRLWALRIIKRKSFPVTAPPGTGKTVFGLIASLYLASRGKKSYLIFPTSVLVKENHEKLQNFMEKTGIQLTTIAYHKDVENKEELKEQIKEGKYQILITTNQFLAQNFPLLQGKRFDFIFVDDVDALLKASRNVQKVLSLLGFTAREISTGVPQEGRKKGILMVSSATAKPGKTAELFFKLLGFRVGTFRNLVRNIEDRYLTEKNPEKLKELLNILGDGGLVFVPREEELKKIYEYLKKENFNIGLATSRSQNVIEKFASGEIDVLLGISTTYGLMVRGLDLPHRIKYVIFYGIPLVRIPVSVSTPGEKLEKFLKNILRDKFDETKSLKENLEKISPEELLERNILIENENLIIPDLNTYIQASGRTSRMYQGGITKGLSIIMDDKDRVRIFTRRAALKGIYFEELDSSELPEIKKQIEEDRKKLKEKVKETEIINPYLFIVESPNKVRQIASFFGKPNIIATEDGWIYEVATGEHVLIIAPSFGHVCDLSIRRGLHGIEVKNGTFTHIFTPIRRCKNCGYSFTDNYKLEGKKILCPKCNSEDVVDSFNHINFLRRLAFEAGNVIICTDPDREGEKIAWDLSNLLAPYARKIMRGEFHEVTKEAILKALRNLQVIDIQRVKSQFLRRTEDRWLGFELSSFLQEYYNDRNLSAGRAQSPVLGWIIERTHESRLKKKYLKLKDIGVEIPIEEEFDHRTVELEIKLKEDTEVRIPPPPPYSTDTLLQDANRFLSLATASTMASLQRLFEAGLITYHRTDSIAISQKGIEIAKKLLGEKFVFRKYTGEGAHEGIRIARPLTYRDIKTHFEEFPFAKFITESDLKLYSLIEKRFLAAFSQEAILRRTTYEIKLTYGKEVEETRYTGVVQKGFLEFYPFWIQIKEKLPEGKITTEGEIVERPASYPYTEAEVVRLMKEKGIGRPSTYSTIISKLLERNYVRKVKSSLISTKRGETIYSLLRKYFGEYISEEVTYKLEQTLDKIEKGEYNFLNALRELYREILEVIEKKRKILSRDTGNARH